MKLDLSESHSDRALKTILVIDDDMHLAATLAAGLEANGYRTLHAPDAATGWKLAHAHLPDLILSDIDMPGKDGRRLLQDMRADPALADRQFILMTGKTAFGGQRAAMDLGADDFLAKPFTLEDLLRCVAARSKRAALSRRIDDLSVERISTGLRSALPQELFLPLASILGLSELAQKDLGADAPEELREDLREINKAGQQLLRTLQNYLLALELEAEGAERQAADLQRDAVADALLTGVRRAGERHRRMGDLALELSAAPVRARAADVSTIIEELVDNALRYSRADTPVAVQAWRDGLVLQILVADSGRGLSSQQLEQLKTSWSVPRTPGRAHGLGLGLMLVRRLVKCLGGDFRLESKDGLGTTAYVTLPVRAE